MNLYSTIPKSIRIFYIVAAGIMFTYVFTRAITVSVTYDEAWTLSAFVKLPFMEAINCSPCDANNHLLNTVLIKLFQLITQNDGVFVGRLPTVLSFLIFLRFAFLISSRFFKPVIGYCCFVLLIANPFVLDFFSLARGYGLSMAFEIMAVYYAVLFITGGQSRHALFAFIAAGLAVLGNYSFLNFALPLFGLVLLTPLLKPTFYQRSRVWLSGFLCLLATIAIAFEPLRKLLKSDGLWYGGSQGFYHDTLVSLVKYSAYTMEQTDLMLFVLNGALILFVLTLAASFAVDRRLDEKRIFLLVLLVGTAASNPVQHLLFDTPYLVDRTALCLLPLFVLVFADADDRIPFRGVRPLFPTLALLFVLNFFRVANFHKTVIWFFDSRTEEVLTAIHDEAVKRGEPIHFGFSWPLNSTMSYNLEHYPDPLIWGIKFDGLDTNKASYFVTIEKSIERVGFNLGEDSVFRLKRACICRWPEEGIAIYKILPPSR